MTSQDIFDRLKAHYGSQTAIASRFGLEPMAVTQWKRRGIPMKYCPMIEADTQGSISCRDLRPDLFKVQADDIVAA